jgi:cell wall assembly regulator SMI1
MRREPLRDDFSLPVGDGHSFGIGGDAIPERLHMVELLRRGKLIETRRRHRRERHGGELSVIVPEDHASQATAGRPRHRPYFTGELLEFEVSPIAALPRLAYIRVPPMRSFPAPGAQKLSSLLHGNPAIAARFAAPPPAADLAARIRDLGVAVPEALLDLYRVCDGSLNADDTSENVPVTEDDGVIVHSLQGVVRWKSFWDGLARAYATKSESERAEAYHHAFWSNAWIPVATGLEKVYALATEPCFGGPAEQIVCFVLDDTRWTVVSDSLDDFLALLADVLASGARSLDDQTLLAFNPGARYVDLIPGEVGAERFDRHATLLADHPSVRGQRADAARALVAGARASLVARIEEACVTRDADRESVVAAVVSAVDTAARSVFGEERRLEASFDDATGDIALYLIVTVVDDVTRPGQEISLEAAQAQMDPGASVGEELMVQIFYLDGQEDSASEQERAHGTLLALDDSYRASLARFRALYPQVVTDALHPT